MRLPRRLARLLWGIALAATPAWAAPVSGPEARVAGLVEALKDPASREAAREGLAALGRDANPALLAYMEDESVVVRWELASLQGVLADERAVPALTRNVLRDDNPHIRWRSLWALTRYPERSEILRLLRAGLAAAEEPARWNAAVGLSMFDLADGLGILHAGARHPDPWRRWEAVNALGRVHDKGTAGVLAPLLGSPSVRDRNEAVLSLGKIGGPAAVDLLTRSLADPAPDVRWRACMALSRAADPRAVPALQALLAAETDSQVLAQARRALDKLAAAP